ncbi:MAG: hypothetical protein ACAI25_21025 [Planctomycetota bacterium]
MKWIGSLVVLLALAGCATPPKPIKRAPPTDKNERPDFKPGPDYFWKKGHWAYDEPRDDYVWIHGSWDHERSNRTWIPGYWECKDDGWLWHEDLWEERAR